MLTPVQSKLLRERNQQIGNICRQWAHVEYQIAHAIWSMLHIDEETGKMLTGGLNISSRLTLAIKLARHLEAPAQAISALEKTQKALSKGLEEKRNQTIHGLRFLVNDPDVDIVEMHKGKYKGQEIQSIEELENLGREIFEVVYELHNKLLDCGVFHSPMQKPFPIIDLNTSTSLSERDSHPSS